MKIAVWHTGHEIADRVAGAMSKLPNSHLLHVSRAQDVADYDVHIAYGILRGTAEIFHEAEKLGKPWFNVDRGYINPAHYNGFYRVSLRGTQTTKFASWMQDKNRIESLGLRFETWRGFTPTKRVLMCPPTKYAESFFKGLNVEDWIVEGLTWLRNRGVSNIKLRPKENGNDDGINDILASNFVYAFNTSLGWQAMAKGIPCYSDPVNSIVGAYYKDKQFDNLDRCQRDTRHDLFAIMSNLQLTLDEMESGKLWELLERLLST